MFYDWVLWGGIILSIKRFFNKIKNIFWWCGIIVYFKID